VSFVLSWIIKGLCKKNSNKIRIINQFKYVNLSQFKNFKKKIKIIIKEIKYFVNRNLKNNIEVYGIGAATKGNTLLNCCSFDDLKIKFILDKSKHKINKFTPGSGIKIIREKKNLKIKAAIILPWNITKHLLKKFSKKGKIMYTSIPKVIIKTK